MDEVNCLDTTQVARTFSICDRNDTAPAGGYILRQQGLRVVPETHPDQGVDRRTDETPDRVVSMRIFSSAIFPVSAIRAAGSSILEKPEKIRECSL